MAYIGYLQVEKLLENYEAMQGLTGCLQAELKAFMEHEPSEDERLYSLAVGNRYLYQDDIPITSAPAPGQRMTAVVNDYHSAIADQDRQAIREIITDRH